MHIKRNQRVTVAGIAATALLLTLFGVFQAGAQPPPTVAQDMAAKEVTLTGRVVDLHCWMTGKMSDADQVKCTQTCIHAGVPAGAALERIDHGGVVGAVARRLHEHRP